MIRIEQYQPPDFQYRPFDPNTVKVFNELQNLVEDVPDIQIEHVGSSSFGAGGKNIIDVLIIHSPKNKEKIIRLLIEKGFQEGDNTTKRTTFVLVGSTNFRNRKYSIHLHLASKDMIVTERMPYFRDYMRQHPELVDEYDNLKKEAQSRGIDNNKEYNAHKASLINKVLDTREWKMA